MIPPAVVIRRGVPAPAEAATLAAFARRTFSEAFAADNPPEDMAAYLAAAYGQERQQAELANPAYITLIAEAGSRASEDGFIIGYAQVRCHPAPDCVRGKSPVELWRFYVDRRWHGTGVAQALMNAALDAGRDLGGKTIWLGVWERNPRAISFYQKCGFQDVGTHVFVLGTDRQTDRVMARSLVA
jgi:ribosomal protein S18 acetylase RimI-like enzyme